MRVRLETGAVEIDLDGQVLGSGGEATIYSIAGQQQFAAKIYHKPNAEQADKLQAMIAAPPVDPMAASGHVSIAWPTDRLLAVNGETRVVGYAMPRIDTARHIHEFYNPKSRLQVCPLFHYGYLMRTARNLAGAVRALHDRGYVIGDINERNLLVTTQALVTLVDTDSFQVKAAERVFRCRVGTAEYTPPELQGARFADIERTPEHDAFGLGVLIFQLLMQGTHPFAGVFTGTGEPGTIARRIANGHWPYAQKRAVPFKPSPHAPPWEVLPAAVQDAFRRCFEDGHDNPERRPTALQWLRTMQEAEKELTVCTANSQHTYPAGQGTCPWCALTRLQGRDPFPPAQEIQTARGKTTARKATMLAAATVQKPPTPAAAEPPPVRTILRPADVPAPPTTRNGEEPLDVLPVLEEAEPLGFVADVVQQWRTSRNMRWLVGGAAAVLVLLVIFGAILVLLLSSGGFETTWSNPNQVQALQSRIMAAHPGGLAALAVSPDGRKILAAGRDRSLSLWDVRTGQQIRLETRADDAVTCIAFSPDSRLAASGTERGRIKLWDMERRVATHELFRHTTPVISLTFSADGQTLVSTDQTGKFLRWDVKTGRGL